MKTFGKIVLVFGLLIVFGTAGADEINVNIPDALFFGQVIVGFIMAAAGALLIRRHGIDK